MSLESKDSKSKVGIPGLTVVSVMAVLFGLVTLSPAIIYLYLAVGSLGGTERFIPVFVTLLLFTEVGRIVRRYITTQEAYIIYFMLEIFALWLASGGLFGGFIINYYYRNAPYTIMYGIADKLPYWFAPPLNSPGPLNRTFISPDWSIPILVALISMFSGLLIDFGLSFITTMVYIDIENLPFPVAPIDVQAISTLTERTPEKIMYFSFAAIISLIYEFLVYGVPNLTEVFLGTRIVFIPYPWVDLTSIVERFLPGAIFGLSTDIAAYVVGWLIPFNVCVWLFIGSLSVWVFGNFLALNIKLPYFELWQKEWMPGVNMQWWYQRATYDLWASPLVGLTIGLSLAVFVKSSRSIVNAFKSLSRLPKEKLRTSYLPLPWIIVMMLTGSLAGFALATTLVPNLWFVWLISWVILPPLQGFLGARAVGETGLTLQIPYVQQALLIPFTAPGDPVPWVTPMNASSSAGIITHRIKVAKLLNVNPLDYYKAYVIFFPLAIIVSFIFWSIFWSMAPIPSSFYPWTTIQWPVSSLYFSLWVVRAEQIFKVDLILGTSVIAFFASFLSNYFTFFSPIGLLSGMGSLPPPATSLFIGALLGKYLEKRIGKERWEVIRSVLIAGIFAGLALALAIAMGLTILGKVITSKPF